MTIESAARTQDGFVVVIDGDTIHVPEDGRNRHYRELMEWETAGGVIAPYEPPAAAIPPITRRQMRLGLLAIDIEAEDVEAHINAIADPAERKVAMVEWQEAGLIERDHPLVEDLVVAFELVPSEVDDLWLWASGL